MKKLFVMMLLTFIFIPMAGQVFADDRDEAVAMVKKAVEYYKTNGFDKAMEEMSNPKGQFVKGELYVFAYDMSMTVITHPTNGSLIGKKLLDLPDADGKYFRREVKQLVTSKGTGWVDYKYLNPKTKALEAKTTYYEKIDDTIFGCGIYRK